MLGASFILCWQEKVKTKLLNHEVFNNETYGDYFNLNFDSAVFWRRQLRSLMGLVLYMPLDEGSGNKTEDKSKTNAEG